MFFFPEEDLLFEIHLLQNVIWKMWIFQVLEEVWFIHFAASKHQLEPGDPNRERMDSLRMLEFKQEG